MVYDAMVYVGFLIELVSMSSHEKNLLVFGAQLVTRTVFVVRGMKKNGYMEVHPPLLSPMWYVIAQICWSVEVVCRIFKSQIQARTSISSDIIPARA